MLRMTLESLKTIVATNMPPQYPAECEVLIRPSRSGICGSDIHAYYGKHPFMSFPIVLGHEFSATVESLGSQADSTSLRPGDRVTAMPQLYCGDCLPCRAGRYNICNSLKVIGCQTPGSMQTLLAVDERLVLRLPDEVSMDEGAMLEPLSVGVHACKRVGLNGKRVLVQGAGTIGNLTAQAAKALGAKEVAVSDYNVNRLDLVSQCGATHIVNLNIECTAKALDRLWGDERADVIIECVGVQGTIAEAVSAARKGTDIVIAGVFGDEISVNMGLVQDKELRIVGTLMYTKEDWLDAIRFVRDKNVTLTPLISCHFPLSELPEAFRYIEDHSDTVVKVLIDAE